MIYDGVGNYDDGDASDGVGGDDGDVGHGGSG